MEVRALKDLVILVADKNMEFSVTGLLSRYPSLGFRELSAEVFVHPHKDPGCLLRGHEFLRPFTRQYRHALIMLDREGSGREEMAREELEKEIESRLHSSGWSDRAAAVVLDPELEVWVWSDSPVVDLALGWKGRKPHLREWLISEGYLAPTQSKPKRPKDAVERALRISAKRRSSAIYLELAQRVGLARCSDPAFVKLRTILRAWFAAGTQT